MEQKIDKRIKYMCVLDTETAPMKDLDVVIPSNMLTYDLGWAIVDKRGKVYSKSSIVIDEIFNGEKQRMTSSYYAEKIPSYLFDLWKDDRELLNFYNARQKLLSDLEKFGVTEIYAHNMRFDFGTLNKTMQYITKKKYYTFFPKEYLICDTLKMARDVILKMPTYRTFCEKHGLLTKTGRLSASAENLYRFITKDPAFVESHTGLEDVMIEKEILAYCIRQKKPMRKALFE